MKYLSGKGLLKFADELTTFRSHYNLGSISFSRIDHLAVKMRNSTDYEDYIKAILDKCSSMTEADLNGRRIATAQLNVDIPLINSDSEKIGKTSYLEIMEPRPHKVGHDIVGIDHCEIVIKSFADTKKSLEKSGILTNQGEGENEYVHTVVVRLNSVGQEVKFSDEPLSDLIIKEISQGISKIIK